ncbi:MAG: hypothetical protein R3234_11775 [Thermoanaerobaculia bacterium]|nr:hypothetical protein [Thermoanaerobaculia bacterium]
MRRILRRAIALAPAAALTLLLFPAPVSGADFQLVVVDPPGEGFNDPTPVSAVPGNPGTTLGEQRINAFVAAAEEWGEDLASGVPVVIEVEMPELPCAPESAVLGAAGPTTVFRDFPVAPRAATWYAAALANALVNEDLDPASPDIRSFFNLLLDDADPDCLGGITWWYGIGGPSPPGTVPFVTVVQHELAHGMGFSTFIDRETGEKFGGFDDAYMVYLEDHSTGETWPEMTDQERIDSTVDTGDLHWIGPRAVEGGSVLTSGSHSSGHVLMYAPETNRPGSSVTHFDTSLSPDELMEPNLTPEATDFLATPLLEDIGWLTVGCQPSPTTFCLGPAGRFEVEVEWEDFEGNRGLGKEVVSSADSAVLWFFQDDNWEMVVKVIDGCLVNERFWFFGAAATNVEYTITVTDTQTLETRIYQNPLGTRAAAIADTDAFATCT